MHRYTDNDAEFSPVERLSVSTFSSGSAFQKKTHVVHLDVGISRMVIFIVAALFIIVVLFYLIRPIRIVSTLGPITEDFEPEKWRSWSAEIPECRETMVDDLVYRYLKRGMAKLDVERLVGLPDQIVPAEHQPFQDQRLPELTEAVTFAIYDLGKASIADQDKAQRHAKFVVGYDADDRLAGTQTIYL